MIGIAELFLIIVNLSMAWYHSRLIKDEVKIHHGYWAAGYLIFAGLVSYFNGSWILFVLALLIRKVLFDLSLNLWLRRKLFYVSKETTSIIDKLHYKLFGNRSKIYMSIYLVSIIILNIILFKK